MTDTKQTSAIADAAAAPRSGRLPAAQDYGPSDTPVRNGHLIGYARVSTRAQDLETPRRSPSVEAETRACR